VSIFGRPVRRQGEQATYEAHGTLIPEHARIAFGIYTQLPIRDGGSRSLNGQGMSARWRRFRVREG